VTHSAPFPVTAQALSNSSIRISWGIPGDSPELGVQVRRNSPGPVGIIASLDFSVTSFDDSGLHAGTEEPAVTVPTNPSQFVPDGAGAGPRQVLLGEEPLRRRQ